MKKFLLMSMSASVLIGCAGLGIVPANAATPIEVNGLWINVIGGKARIVASPDKEFVYAADLEIPGEVIINGETVWISDIEANAFEGVQEIKSLNIDPNLGAITIGKEAFKGSGVETVVVGSAVFSIEESAFEGSALKSLIIKKRLMESYGEVPELYRLKISDRAFADTKNLKSIESEQDFKHIDWTGEDSSSEGCYDYYFSNTANGVFAGSGLESITLYPELCGRGMFKDCDSLKEVKFAEDNQSVTYVIYPEQFCGTSIEDFIFPKEAQTILGDRSFANISGLRSVTVSGRYSALLNHPNNCVEPDADVRNKGEMEIYEKIGCFLNSGNDATLYLSKKLFEENAQYRISLYGFKEVKMIGESGVESVEAGNVCIKVHSGSVTVDCAAGSQVVAIGLSGIAVRSESYGGSCRFDLAPGVYVITVDGICAGKVIVP